ncbi:hypothetical protein BJV82DRAFT_611417 [Fennellomyces sp. T-0311]|nr:hypothetical protein BJV82DRAFT_611417 [Fennellomyces sp. T-0311]
MLRLPSYDELPIDIKYPPKSAWGVFGDDDKLGTLNLLTKERIASAAKCMKQGKLFKLNWKPERHNSYLWLRGHVPRTFNAFEDGWNIATTNDDTPTEWHGAHSFSCADDICCRFYNGVTASGLFAPSDFITKNGISGRAILLDYGRWAGNHFNPLLHKEITVDELNKVAQAQGITEFKQGDILLIRTGWISAYEKSGGYDPLHPQCAGVVASEDTFRWLWNNGFAAVASDNFSFEAFPLKREGASCHSRLIGSWGMPIGEMFYLDHLAEDSALDGVYEYFFTNIPAHQQQGTLSPSDIVCAK